MSSLVHAAKPLLLDFLSTIVFLVLIAMKVDPTIAASLAIGLGVAQVLFLKVTGRPVAPLQWMGLGLVLVFGTASLLTHDTRFLMVKPTIVYLLIGGVMLQRGWMLRYLPPVAAGHGEDVMVAFGYVWAGLMLFTAVANAVVAIADAVRAINGQATEVFHLLDEQVKATQEIARRITAVADRTAELTRAA